MPPRIHPTAEVEPGASVGDDTAIWRHVHVRAGAAIGARCSLGQGCYVAATARLGDGCRVQNNVSLYDGVTLDDDVFVGPSAVFTNVKRPRAAFPSPSGRFAPTHVGRGASIGANATIVCGVTVGEGAMVGAGAVVTRDVPPYTLVVGQPARVVGLVCACGASLQGPPGGGRKYDHDLAPADLRCPCGRRYAHRAGGGLALIASH